MPIVLIDGYENAPLVDGTALLTERLFWPTYLAAWTDLEDDTVIDAAFSVERDELEAFYGQLTALERWPVLAVPLRAGAQIVVIFRNLEDDTGVDLLLQTPDSKGVMKWARLDGHFLVPGLSWPELAEISSRPGSRYGVTESHARMLLLLPFTGDSDTPATAAKTVSSALIAAGAAPGPSGPLADNLLNEPMGGTAQWRKDANGTLTCDAPNSTRNPSSSAALTTGESMRLSNALRGIA
ncbi:hypothetical protein ABZ914_22580 [Spirillospora sp. NPDC046719]